MVRDERTATLTDEREPSESGWIERDLYYHGAEPPRSKQWTSDDWVEVPHEGYIPVTKWRINKLVRASAGAESEKLQSLLRLVEGLLHFRHHRTLNELKRDYQLFSPETGGNDRRGMTDEELIEHQRSFLANFLRTMVKGNFLPFDTADYERAVSQSYLLDVPVDINWESHDPRLIDDFLRWADGDEGRALRDDLGLDHGVREFLSAPEEIGSNALVFYRGLERDQAEGRFFVQRLDILVNWIIKVLGFPIIAPLQWVLDRRNPRSPATSETRSPRRSTTMFLRRWVRRKNLQNTPLLRGFLRPQQLQEPAFRQVVVLFRQSPKRVDRSLGGIVGANHDESDDRDWNIQLKLFQHIPMADAELVFPEKKIRMGSFDLAVLILSSLAAVPAVVNAIVKGSSGAVAIAIGLGMYMARVVGRYMRVRTKYMARMTRNLYEKNLDNSVGVIQYLVDSLEEQEYKEVILAYVALWRAGRSMTRTEIDRAVERLLHEEFDGIEIDFEAADALRKVVDRGAPGANELPIIVEERDGGESRYRAKPLDEALRVLDEQWDALFHYNV